MLDLLADQIEGIDYDFVMFNGDCIDDPRNESEVVHFLSYLNKKVKAENVPVFICGEIMKYEMLTRFS